jgi:hypothetical protein
MAWRRRATPDALLVVAMAAAADMLIVLGRRLTFFQDVWDVLVERQYWNARDHLVGGHAGGPFGGHRPRQRPAAFDRNRPRWLGDDARRPKGQGARISLVPAHGSEAGSLGLQRLAVA